MKPVLMGCMAAALLALLAVSGMAADSLEDVRTEVRTDEPAPPRREPEPVPPAPRKPKPYSFDERCQDEEEDDDSIYGKALAGGAVLVVTSPYWIPISVLEGSDAPPLCFSPAPYEVSPGWMAIDAADADGYAWGSQLRAEYLDDYDRLTAYRARLLVEHTSRWGFDTETNFWRESTAPGVHDELWTGDANIVFRFAQSERVQLRSGVGLAWLSDQTDTDLGFNFTYGGEFYPVRPLVLSAELDAGWIGHAWMFHLRSTAGVVYKQAEVYVGYDYLEIGNAQLDGVVAGVKVFF